MEEELVSAIYELIEAVNNLAEPTEIDIMNNSYSLWAIVISVFVFFFSMQLSYDLNRTQGRISLYRERISLYEETLLQFERLTVKTDLITSKFYLVKSMPEYKSLALMFLFNEKVYNLYIKIEKNYIIIQKLKQSSFNNDKYIEILFSEIKDDKDELCERIVYFLDIFREPEKMSPLYFITYTFNNFVENLNRKINEFLRMCRRIVRKIQKNKK